MNILAITLNPAIDATYVVRSFARGGGARVIRQHRMPGGKGNNVARILAARGHRVIASGFLGGGSGDFIEDGLRGAGVEPAFVRLPAGESRTCHTILEAETGVASEILETGPEVDRDAAAAFLARLPALLARVDVVSLSGSAPPGLDPSFLDRLGHILRSGPCARFVLDSSGETLRILLRHTPDLIKPNLSEMQALMGRDANESELMQFARGALASGDRKVLFSLAAAGAVLISQDGMLRSDPPRFRPVNTVGCGDALLAGYLEAWLAGGSRRESLANAIAFASAAAGQETAGVVHDSDIERFRPDVQIIDQLGLAESAAQ